MSYTYHNNYKFETIQLHAGQENPDPASDARAVPIYQTTSYVFKNSAHAAARFGLADAGNIYGRLTNSTQDVFESTHCRVGRRRGGTGDWHPELLPSHIPSRRWHKTGDHIVAQKTIYGGSYNLLAHTLPQYGIDTTFVDAHDLAENWKPLFRITPRQSIWKPWAIPTAIFPISMPSLQIAHKHGLPSGHRQYLRNAVSDSSD